MKKTVCGLLCVLLAVSAAACGGKPGTEKPGDETSKFPPLPTVDGYTPSEHLASNNFLRFASADQTLDNFLNEFTLRHMRDSSISIGGQTIGYSTRPSWREWDSMIGSWWDASAANGAMSANAATNDQVNKWLVSPKQDNQGYVWCDGATGDGSWGLGWKFPSAETHGGKEWLFNGSADADAWTLKDAFNYNATVSSSAWQIKTKNAVDSIEMEADFGVSVRASAFLRIGFSFSPVGKANIDDLYVYYTTNEEGKGEFSEDRKVAFSEFCINGFDITGKVALDNYFFPMYLLEDWGDFNKVGSSRTIEKIKIVLKGNSKFEGTFSLGVVGSDYDDRHLINNCNYIIAAKNNLQYARGEELLPAVLPKARAAMNFLLKQCGGETGLVSTEYFVGHFNNYGAQQRGAGIGNGYWDVDAFPTVNLYCNTSYYNALESMIYLEEMAKNLGIEQYDAPVTTVNATMSGTDTYTKETAASLTALWNTCRTKIQTTFWNEETQRFHAGFYDDEPDLPQDHGYLLFNQQTITSGIATEAQKQAIMQWVNGERIVEGDNSTGEDIYYYEIAPRFNTEDIADDFSFVYGVRWDGNVQNGGTALQCAYYDIVAQSMIGANSSYAKLKKLQAWYEKVKAAGGEGDQFYRVYYATTNIKLQGGTDANGKDQNGLVGVDYEFLEAALVFSAIPDSYFGLDTIPNGTLCFTPNMPDSLDWLRMENLVFGGYYYDVTAGYYSIELSNVHEYAKDSGNANAKLQVTLKVPDKAYKVYVSGVETQNFTVNQNGTLTVTVPMANCKVELGAA